MIKIRIDVVTEKKDLDKAIISCMKHGMRLIRSAGGELPKYCGYFAEMEGEHWRKTLKK